MNKTYLHIILCFFTTLIATACTDDWEMPEKSKLTGEETLVKLNLGFSDFNEVRMTTRASLNESAESRVHNLFVFVFANGKRIFTKYYDNSNRETDKNQFDKSTDNCWWVQNLLDTDPKGSKTQGSVSMRCPGVMGGNLYIVANIDADMVNISPEQMNAIQTENDLKNLTAELNQQTVSRNGFFPMTANVEGVNITKTGISLPNTEKTVHLKRLDAKIQFKFTVAEGTSQKDDSTKQTVKAFIPESWHLINIPKGSYVFPQATDNATAGFFNTDIRKFETEETVGPNTYHGFSFYILENRQTPKASVNGDYHLRDKRIKDAEGKYDNSNGLWVYAPEMGTYLEVKGRILMDVDVSSEAKTQQLEADVKYYIHLGDLKKSMDDYSIERNTSYTYTITIKGVNNIEIEVETSKGTADEVKEGESGATGMVYVAKESIFTFDAHYGQRVFCFDADHIDPRTVTWYVKTPFGKEGVPNKVGDTEVPAGMDYKWVHFYLNEINTDSEPDPEHPGLYTGVPPDKKPYSQNNQPYPGDNEPKLMDVVQFTKYIKDQKRKFIADPTQGHDFRREFDPLWWDWAVKNGLAKGKKKSDDGKWWRYRIYMTVFVDEFYYEKDPINGNADPMLWKRFVNQPNRLMHILCDSERSLDGESTATGSVITLRQQSIQTPYNVNKKELTTAWGCECVDETADSYLWFYGTSDGTDTNNTVFGNNSQSNGLYNTAHLWGVLAYGSVRSIRWDSFLNFKTKNDHTNKDGYNILFLKEQEAKMRYSAMMRNRDNNGNGVIDPEEIRWYIASIDQLYGLYMGQQGINDAAALYTRQRASQEGQYPAGHPYSGAWKWRYHVISSTRSERDQTMPIILWSEEGVSVSPYRLDKTWGKHGRYAVRCVRNLGLPDANTSTLSNPAQNVPEQLIKVKREGDVYSFDLSNMNPQSLRFYTSKELDPQDEFSEMSMTYKGFKTGRFISGISNYENGIKAKIESGISPCDDGYRTKGERVPNVREGALMSLYCDQDWWSQTGNIMVSSFYSNGSFGRGREKDSSWFFNYGFASINGGSDKIRTVKDWNPTLP